MSATGQKIRDWSQTTTTVHKVFVGVVTGAALFVAVEVTAHRFSTVPSVALLIEEQCHDSCIRRCQTTCSENGVPLGECTCAHCNSECASSDG